MGISRFEDLIAWQKARLLAATIYRFSTQGAFAKDYGLKDQIQRAVVSVMSNIAEGFERVDRLSFISFWLLPKPPALKCVASFISQWMSVTLIRLHLMRYLHWLRGLHGWWEGSKPQ